MEDFESEIRDARIEKAHAGSAMAPGFIPQNRLRRAAWPGAVAHGIICAFGPVTSDYMAFFPGILGSLETTVLTAKESFMFEKTITNPIDDRPCLEGYCIRRFQARIPCVQQNLLKNFAELLSMYRPVR
jgi:hypothetical protein